MVRVVREEWFYSFSFLKPFRCFLVCSIIARSKINFVIILVIIFLVEIGTVCKTALTIVG